MTARAGARTLAAAALTAALAWTASLAGPAASAAPAPASAAQGASAASAAQAGAAKVTIKAGTIKIQGSPTAFKTLKVKLKGWRAPGMTLKYRWYANGKPIKGATKTKLTVPQSAVRKRITVKVLAKAPGAKSVLKSSARTKAVSWPKLDRRCRVKGRVICADKTLRKVYQVKNGKILGAWDARFGRKGMRTHNGVFKIYLKHRNHTSSEWGGSMPYAQFFKNGEAVHFSPSFTTGVYGVGSHGCVNLGSRSGARKLFNFTKVGDRVVVYGRDH